MNARDVQLLFATALEDRLFGVSGVLLLSVTPLGALATAVAVAVAVLRGPDFTTMHFVAMLEALPEEDIRRASGQTRAHWLVLLDDARDRPEDGGGGDLTDADV